MIALRRESSSLQVVDEPVVEEEPHEEYELTKAQYDEWLGRLNEQKYSHYLAWFAINIKQAGAEPAPSAPAPPNHDYRINVPID